jgi:DNA replication and repair protein RecF
VHVAHLSLADFRSYDALELALDAGVTTFVGLNGQGKTNLVEAVGYLATLGSHRVSADAPLVRQGASRAVVRGSVRRDERTTLVEVELVPGRANRARVNRAPVPRAREVLGILRTVLFAPEDLAVVRGDPSERRRFLDDVLVARAPRYAGVRADYERVLKQRNALLKSAGAARRGGRSAEVSGQLGVLDVWDTHLARAGAALLYGRLRLVDELRPLVEKAYDAVASGGGPAGVQYRSSVDADGSADRTDSTGRTDRTPEPLPLDADALARVLAAGLEQARAAELERGVSLVGPHRDDLLLTLGTLPARGYASHGEGWSLALALRLASYELLRGDGSPGGEPVLLLDDVFAELDARRRERLAELVAPAEQVLVTAAVPDDVPAALRGARFRVEGGQVRRD